MLIDVASLNYKFRLSENELKLPLLHPKLIDLIMGRLIFILRAEPVTVALVWDDL